MEIPRITLDTHSLIWYMHEDSNHLLSAKALDAIQEAERSGIIYIPTIALMEILDLTEKERLPASIPFDTLLEFVEKSKAYQITPLNAHLLRISIPLRGMEIHDKLIAATAIMTESVLVSKDRTISASGASVLW